MKFSLIIGFLGLLVTAEAQEIEKTDVFKLDGINVFVKCEPIADYEVLEEINASGALKGSKTHSQVIGAAGFNKLKYAIQEMNDMNLKDAKKDRARKFDGVMIADKPNKVLVIKLKDGAEGTIGMQGAKALAQREKKTGKLVFYASKPTSNYEVIENITYNQGGLGETMRGGNSMDVAINGMLDKGLRWVKKGKINSDFDGLIIDWRMLRLGKIRGELIRFTE